MPLPPPTMLLALMALLSVRGGEEPAQAKVDAWRDVVSFRMPEDAAVKERLQRSARWLVEHIVTIKAHDDGRPLRVIAWKDPTLAPRTPSFWPDT